MQQQVPIQTESSQFVRHRGPVTCVSGIPNSNAAVTSGYDGAVGYVDLSAGTVELMGYHDHLANKITVNEAGTKAASSSSDFTIYIWDLATRQVERILKGHSDDVEDFVFVDDDRGVSVSRDWRIIVPIVLLTVIFPFLANWGAGRMVQWVGQYDAEIVGERLIPFLLMIVGFFPISFSLIIALESFVGEKERRSLEPLLSTPVTDTQLYIGKTLSSTVPPLVGSILGISVYLVGVYINVGWMPSPMLLFQIILLNVIQALVMVSGAVVVSSQTTSGPRRNPIPFPRSPTSATRWQSIAHLRTSLDATPVVPCVSFII